MHEKGSLLSEPFSVSDAYDPGSQVVGLPIGKHVQNPRCIFVGYAHKEKMLSFGELWYHKTMYP